MFSRDADAEGPAASARHVVGGMDLGGVGRGCYLFHASAKDKVDGDRAASGIALVPRTRRWRRPGQASAATVQARALSEGSAQENEVLLLVVWNFLAESAGAAVLLGLWDHGS